jgi:hypothetical protein
MYDNQYDREIMHATENAIKTQKDVLSLSICCMLYIIIHNKKLFAEAMKLALELIILLLKCANSELKSPH